MISVLGISYKTGNVSVREKFSFSAEEISTFNQLLKSDHSFLGLVVVSTCNRTEIYFETLLSSPDANKDFIVRYLSEFKDSHLVNNNYFYFLTGLDVARHLFSVVSGIDSMIIGEDQIVMQVKKAFGFCFDNKFVTAVLTRLFYKSFETGNKVRTETSIAHGAASVSSAAVEVCTEIFPDTLSKKILLIGAGQTAELALLNFSKRGCKNIFVTNRTAQKALDIASAYSARTLKFKDLYSYVNDFDIVIVATSSKSKLIKFDNIESSSRKRVFVDLSVPLNIDPSISKIQNVTLFAVDDLQSHVVLTGVKRRKTIDQAEVIISKSVDDFSAWYSARNLSPLIMKIKDNLVKVNDSELAGFMKIHSVSDDKFLSLYAQHITDKFARLFIKNVKIVTDSGKNNDNMNLIKDLFDF